MPIKYLWCRQFLHYAGKYNAICCMYKDCKTDVKGEDTDMIMDRPLAFNLFFLSLFQITVSLIEHDIY